jgi:hypothetical protein
MHNEHFEYMLVGQFSNQADFTQVITCPLLERHPEVPPRVGNATFVVPESWREVSYNARAKNEAVIYLNEQNGIQNLVIFMS